VNISEWVLALLGASGVTAASLFKYGKVKTARARAGRSDNPLEIFRAEDSTEPGPIWALVTPAVLERHDLSEVVRGENRGSWTPNRFRRDAQKRWAMYDAERTVLQLTLVNKREIPLYVTSIAAVIEGRGRTPSGTLIENPPQGAMEIRNLQLHLDSDDLTAKSPDGARYFESSRLELLPEAAEFMCVSAVVGHGAYEWRLVISVMTDSGAVTRQVFPPEGKPAFRTAAQLHEERYEREWLCSTLFCGLEDAQEAPFLRDRLQDYNY
jgi:hypothetical protein